MRMTYIEHVDFEDLAHIEVWAQDRGHSLTKCMLINGEPAPAIDSYDCLIVLGGPMSVYEDEKHPWLKLEKHVIREAIENNKMVLGICLGAQLIAEVLGAKVYPNNHKEIGWHSVELTKAAAESPYFSGCPHPLPAFHWHGDVFDIPMGATKIGSSTACENQAFVMGDRVIALQFHLEFTPSSLARLVRHCADQLVDGPYIQRAEQILWPELIEQANGILTEFLDNMVKQWKRLPNK